MSDNDAQGQDLPSSDELAVLCEYVGLDDPFTSLRKRSLQIMTVTVAVYLGIAYWIPAHLKESHYLFHCLIPDYKQYVSYVQQYLLVDVKTRALHLMLLCYLSLYASMWWVYFQSKVSEEAAIEAKRLKIQTLRRLLGAAARQWQPHATSDEIDSDAIEMFRRKGAASMQVIAILIAVSTLIFSRISYIWMTNHSNTLWQQSLLWIGILASVFSFISFMMCVDSLDTIFNRFSNDPVRNVLVKYFYEYTINPRYAATASMLLSIVMLLAYYSEVLASIAIAMILWVGYSLWFPNISASLKKVKPDNYAVTTRKSPPLLLLLLLPLIVYVLVILYHA